MAELSAGARAAAAWVRSNPGAMQWRVIKAIQGTSSYDTAWRKVKEAREAGLIVTRKSGNQVYLYPAG